MKELYQPEAASTVLFAFIGNPWALLGCYLLVMNLVAFLVFGLDKWKAKRKVKNEAVRRVPERVLFLLAKIKDLTGGDSLASNIQLVYNNARLAAKTAGALCALAKG